MPGYLSAVSGVGVAELDDADWRRVLVPSLLFIASFSAIFIGLGLTATGVGEVLREHRDLLTDIAGVLIIVMGVLFVASFFVARLNREWRVDALLERAGKGGPLVAGAAFAVAWTPCIGPTLAAILSAAALTGSVGHGALLLAFYSAGLGVPFLLSAIAFSRMATRVRGRQAPLRRDRRRRRRDPDRDGDPDPHRRVLPAQHRGPEDHPGPRARPLARSRRAGAWGSGVADLERLADRLELLELGARRSRASRRCGSGRCRSPGSPMIGSPRISSQPRRSTSNGFIRTSDAGIRAGRVVAVDRDCDRLEVLGFGAHRSSV